MTTVEAITAAIAKLPQEEEARLRAWFDEQADAQWDAQIEKDGRTGRFDALAGHRAGRTRPLCTVADPNQAMR